MGPMTSRLLPIAAVIGLVLMFWQQQQLTNLLRWNRSFFPFAPSTTSRGAADPEAAFKSSKIIHRRVVAVADLHGDLEHAHNVFRMAGLIDNQYLPNWIGGHSVLVSTGDIVDRGDDTIKLYELFQRLRIKAAEAGGAVWNCLGNHEVMNALGDWRYVTEGDIDTFGGKGPRRYAMSSEGWIGKEWLANFSITHTIPLLEASHLPESLARSYQVPLASFVHGGIHPTWAAQGVERINEVGHSLLQKALDNPRPSGWLPPKTTEEEKLLYGESGPLWNRHYATADDESACDEADQARASLSVRHLVMGHTPHLSGFVVRCDTGILLIDTGISRAYGGEQSALVFDVQLKPVGKGIWEEEEVISALYKGRRPRILDTKTRTVQEDESD